MRIPMCLFFILLPFILFCQELSIAPYPNAVSFRKGSFLIDKHTKIIYDKMNQATATMLRDFLTEENNLNLQVNDINSSNQDYTNSIQLQTTDTTGEAYTLDISESKISIKGSETGVFYGMRTLCQLLYQAKEKYDYHLGCLKITDNAHMRYRGLHLDCSRHFFSKTFIKKYLDLMSMYKLNRFHWHLTDDQGWRVEIKKYPRLTAIGGCRAQTLVGPYGTEQYDGKPYCGYYTQDDIREIVAYAAARKIEIIPEIEMPGHCMAALTAYPYLGCTGGPYKTMETWGVADEVMCAGKDSTFVFLQDVIDEIATLFPSPYIHIGGDECPKERWKNCDNCTKRIQQEGLNDTHVLQSYFVKRMEKYINSKGKKIIGWDEIMEGGLAPNATVMSWRGEAGGIEAANQNHDVIMTPGKPLYFDYSQSANDDSLTQGGLNTLKDVYDYNPIPSSLNAAAQKYILGAQANVWTEYMDNEKKVEYMICPRVIALAETLWTKPENKKWDRFEKSLPKQLQWLSNRNYHYSKACFDLESDIQVRNGFVQWQLKSTHAKNIVFKKAGSDAIQIYKEPIMINKTGNYQAYASDKNGNPISAVISNFFNVNQATGKKILLKNPPHQNYSRGGAATLVDGIQNDRGMQKSAMFLGFWGTDLEATIDLEKTININSIELHTFEQAASWIYPPSSVDFFVSNDGMTFQKINDPIMKTGKQHQLFGIHSSIQARYVKIVAINYGLIHDGLPGAGNQAWLFADEITID